MYEELNLLECYAVRSGKQLQTFGKIVVPSTGSNKLGRLFLTFVASVNIYQSTRCNLPEVSNFRIHIHQLSVCLVNIATVFGMGHLCTRKYGYPLIGG